MSLLGVACVGVPDKPLPVEDLSELNAQYAAPTAVLPIERVRPLLDAAREALGPSQAFAGLTFTRLGISETSAGLEESVRLDGLNIDGRADATTACPGDGLALGPNDAGHVLMTFGVEASHLKRAFSGTFESCRFQASSPYLGTQHVVLGASFTADLGADVRLGSPVPPAVLLHLRNVTGSSNGPLASFDLTRDEYHFRLTEDGALEVLMDAVMIGTDDLGSVVVVARAAGYLGLRESRGQWHCGAEDQACVLSP